MIKMRLVRLLSHAKKYIMYTVIWQWIALLSQIIAIFSIGTYLGKLVKGKGEIPETGGLLLILAVVMVVRFVCEKM